MATHKTIYLDDEGELLWDTLVKKGINMSGLFKASMNEELKKEDNLELLSKKLEDAMNKRSELDNEITQLQAKVDRSLKKNVAKEAALREIDPSLIVPMTKGIMRQYNITEVKAKNLALDYLGMGEDKPTLQAFMKDKFMGD